MKRNMIIAIMITFCFTASLFMVIPIRSAVNPYDPWVDVNDDGKINLQELSLLAKSYNTAGTPINKTALLLDLEDKVDALNSSLLSMQDYFNMRIVDLEATVGEQQVRIANLETELAVLNATKLGQPDYDSGWINLPLGGGWTFLTHNLNTTRVLVYLIAKDTGSFGIHQMFYGVDGQFDINSQLNKLIGASWGYLGETQIAIYRGYQDSCWPQARVMMWKIP